MKITILIIWILCLLSMRMKPITTKDCPRYIPGQAIQNLKPFAVNCMKSVARETPKIIRWIRLSDLKQVNLKILDSIFQ